MKHLMLAIVTMGVSFGVCAAELLDTCFQFQTLGDDCYADGTPLAEGECYALVWRHKDLAGSIEGLFNSSGTPVNAQKCEILGVFNVASEFEYEGHRYSSATNAWIVLPNGHYTSHSETGVYSLFVFDTRTWNGSKWVLGGKTSDKTVASLRRYGLVTNLENIKIGTGADGTFFSYNVGMYGTKFVGNESMTSFGDVSEYYSCADRPTVGVSKDCAVAFCADEETVSSLQMRVAGQPLGTLSTPAARPGLQFVGWFTFEGAQVTSSTIMTKDLKLLAHWTGAVEREPLFSEVTIANGKAILCVTNTLPSQNYDISWGTQLADVLRTTNWVNSVKKGVETGPLTWEIDLQGNPQGYFRVLKK